MILWKCSPPSGSPLDYPGQAWRVSTWLRQDPPFPVRAPPHGRNRVRFSSWKGNLKHVAGVCGSQSPSLCQEEGPVGGSAGFRRAGASMPAGSASHSCWRCHGYQASLPLLPTRQPLTLRSGLSRDQGSWVSWKRFPGTHRGLPHWRAEPAGKGHPRGHL